MKQEYKDHEFCKDIACEGYSERWKHVNGVYCVYKGRPRPDCARTARDFIKWLKQNGYRIVKDVE